MKASRKSQMYESNIQSLQQKIQEIESSFQMMEGEMKERPRNAKVQNRSFNRSEMNSNFQRKGLI